MLESVPLQQYELLHRSGMAAKDAGNHQDALADFVRALELAYEYEDPLKQLHALNPAARAHWSMGQYDEAAGMLRTAHSIAKEHTPRDEQGAILTNLGRLAAVKTLHVTPVDRQAAALREESIPHFKKAHDVLADHPHLYYRYANAQHGSVAAALAGERHFAGTLIAEGLDVAFRTSDEPYDQKPTYQINPRGLAQIAVATALIPLGNTTPVLADFARHNMVR